MAVKKIKRKPKKLLIIILLILVLALLGVIYYFVFFDKDQVKEIKVVSEIPEYGYKLKNNKSAAYKKLFQELKDVLKEKEVDEKKYVKTITKMFIVDFYSLGDHIAKTDVGGTDFVHQDILDNFMEKADDTIYKYVESNIYKQRKQNLPIIDQVTIDKVSQEEYTYGDKSDEKSYKVEASWTYKNPTVAEGYQTSAIFTYVHDGKKLVLVEISEKSE